MAIPWLPPKGYLTRSFFVKMNSPVTWFPTYLEKKNDTFEKLNDCL